jgi:hypothetical protein
MNPDNTLPPLWRRAGFELLWVIGHNLRVAANLIEGLSHRIARLGDDTRRAGRGIYFGRREP